jgi:hypothetical protein
MRLSEFGMTELMDVEPVAAISRTSRATCYRSFNLIAVAFLRMLTI